MLISGLCYTLNRGIEMTDYKIFLKHLSILCEQYEQWNMDERDDGISMHTDCLDDFKRWLYMKQEEAKNRMILEHDVERFRI